jgi:vesicle-associated membrane protein 72
MFKSSIQTKNIIYRYLYKTYPKLVLDKTPRTKMSFDNVSLEKVQSQVEEVKSVMKNNIEKAVDREQNLLKLEEHTEELQIKSKLFHSQSKSLRYLNCMKKSKIYILFLFMFVIFILLIVWACGGFN